MADEYDSAKFVNKSATGELTVNLCGGRYIKLGPLASVTLSLVPRGARGGLAFCDCVSGCEHCLAHRENEATR